LEQPGCSENGGSIIIRSNHKYILCHNLEDDKSKNFNFHENLILSALIYNPSSLTFTFPFYFVFELAEVLRSADLMFALC
jgi:hypothetical protein